MIVGTLLGKKVLGKIPEKRFTVIFEAVLAALAILLLVQGVMAMRGNL